LSAAENDPDGFSVQSILEAERGFRDLRMLAREGDDLIIPLTNLLGRECGVSHLFVHHADS
jgi:hypothetical protein